MEDLQKIKEFFSKPLEEDSMSKFAYYSNNELNFYAREKTQQRADYALKCPDPKIVDKLDKEIEAITHELKKRSQKIKEFFSKPLPEEAKEDPTDIIAMDVPLFLRMLEWAKEEAAEDIDLHEVTERAIEAVKLRGLLSMDDYQDLIGEPIEEETGYSKYLATPENPKGKTPGLTPDVLNKILMKIANVDDIDETIRLGENVVYEELCPKGKAYIKKRQAAGEKSSAYLSGRAVKVCKGQMKG